MTEIIKENPTLDIEAYKNVFKYHDSKRFPIRSRANLIWFFIYFFIGTILAILSYINESTGNFYYGIVIFLFSIFFFYKYFTRFGRIVKLNNKIAERNMYKINSEGYVEFSGNHRSEYKWSHFIEAKLEKELILLYKNKFDLILFSKNNYTEEEFNTIKRWISDKVKIL
jgi:hypothetical protein